MNDRRHRSRPRLDIWGLSVLLGVASIAVLWVHSAAEHTAALRWMQGYKGARSIYRSL